MALARFTGLLTLAAVASFATAPARAADHPRSAGRHGVDAHATETARNRAIVTAFADVFYRQGDIERAMTTYVDPIYIQHSPAIPTGRAAMLELAKRFAGRPKPMFEVKRILVDGDMAVVHVRGQLAPTLPAEAVIDLYRLKDGKIVEHWDVRQAVPASAANTNTMF